LGKFAAVSAKMIVEQIILWNSVSARQDLTPTKPSALRRICMVSYLGLLKAFVLSHPVALSLQIAPALVVFLAKKRVATKNFQPFLTKTRYKPSSPGNGFCYLILIA
jgi:hypothetical protein